MYVAAVSVGAPLCALVFMSWGGKCKCGYNWVPLTPRGKCRRHREVILFLFLFFMGWGMTSILAGISLAAGVN